jgi:hypothetical protein
VGARSARDDQRRLVLLATPGRTRTNADLTVTKTARLTQGSKKPGPGRSGSRFEASRHASTSTVASSDAPYRHDRPVRPMGPERTIVHGACATVDVLLMHQLPRAARPAGRGLPAGSPRCLRPWRSFSSRAHPRRQQSASAFRVLWRLPQRSCPPSPYLADHCLIVSASWPHIAARAHTRSEAR